MFFIFSIIFERTSYGTTLVTTTKGAQQELIKA